MLAGHAAAMPRGAARERTIAVRDSMEGAHSMDDEARLRQLGYKQELRRELNLLKNFAVSFGLLSMLTGLGGFYYFGFSYGGPVIPVWGWPLVVFFTFTIALSMAEICSALPTSGGVYFWSGVLAGPYGPLFSWISGWLQMLGQVGMTAGVEYTLVRFLEQMIQVQNPDFALTGSQLFGIYCGFIIFHASINCISTKLLGFLSMASVCWHVVGTLTIVIGLPIIAPTRQSANWVFTEFIPPNPAPAPEGVGIGNDFYVFTVGLLLCQWAMVGYDTSAHVAEETKNAAFAGPVGLLMAITGSFICGWMFLISLTFSIQDVANTQLGGTFAIFKDCFTGRYGSPDRALSFMVIIFVAANFCGTFCITANSRLLYAFARDNGVFGSRYWKQVNSRTGTPVNAVIFMSLGAIALGTPVIGSTVAFNAIASIGIIGMILSYLVPIFLRVTLARTWFKKGPVHMGRFSFFLVILCLPTAYPITKDNLNYAPVAVGSLLILSLSWWIISARKWFKGPVRNVDTGNKTSTLAEAYMQGELDDNDSDGALANEKGSTGGGKESVEGH
ncbi:hypothetical protein N2152v2_003190 [Parachlorella kessleri]